jgi:glycosyltransferase involved in cell wall biosynthesis
MRSLWTVRQLLNPWRYGFSSLQLFSHKVLRWMTPWPLMSLLFSSLILAHSSRFYAAAFAVQAGFYAVALAFAFVPQPTLRRLAVPGALTLPFYFCLTYTASTWAQLLLLCGRRWDRWDATHTIRFPLRAKRSKVAYIMSRFPKITETFVLYEILEHRRRGDAVEVYPLMREHQSVAHPDVERLLDCVHFLPFYSPAIVRANWYYLRHSPRAYLGTVAEAVRGNFGSTRLLLGALAFLPKSVAFAFEMERSGVTHVHAHFATHPALSAWIIHRLTGIPFSFTAHAHDVFGDRQMLREKLTSAAFAVTISEHNREFMARECGEDIRRKIHVIHCGVDVGYFTPPTVRTQSGPLRILCLASLWEVKGHTYLIEACRLLRQRGIAFHCHFIGDGECRAQLVEQISRVGLQDAFTFLGPQPRSVVRRMLHDAQVKVLACVPLPDGVRDGIPVALMEAIACGLPVISTVLSGIPELVDNGVSGILVAPRDPLALAEALERLACDPELRLRMGRYGRDKVMREFNLAANAEKLAALFAEPAVGDPVARSA